jgi:uncharacterized protein
MNKLHISPDLSLPLEAVTNTHLIPARRRVGKSYTGAVMAEEMIKARLPWVALDPTGVWWGLTSSADGKSEGFPVIVIGGPHGHIPLEPSAGKVIANLVVDNPGWYVIDFSRFENARDERMFAAAFGVQLYRRKQRKPSALHLFIDEADMFVPQKLPKDGKEMFDAYDAIVRRGGVYGLGVTLITQRPALVNKDVSTQCETLIALQTSAPQDQDPIFDWVSRNGNEEQLKEIKRTLASLKVGQAWYFSPNTDMFKLINIRQRETFNSSATPKPGAKAIEPKVFANIDIAKLGEEIAATVERTQKEDPAFLRRKIADLERQLEQARVQQPEAVKQKVIEVPVLNDEEIQRINDLIASVNESLPIAMSDMQVTLEKAKSDFILGMSALASIMQDAVNKIKWTGGIDFAKGFDETVVRRPAEILTSPLTLSKTLKASEGITSPQQRILDAIAWLETVGLSRARRTVVAFLAGQSPKSSGYTNNLGALRSMGLLTYPDSDSVELTNGGRTLAYKSSRPATSEELQTAILGRLPRPQRNILQVLIDNYPSAVDRDAVAKIAGQSPTSSGYTNNLGALRSLGVIDYPDSKSVVALPVLFLE